MHKWIFLTACLIAVLGGCNQVFGIRILPNDDDASVDASPPLADMDASVDAGTEAGEAAPPPLACMPGDQRCSPNAPVIQACDLQGIWRDTQTVCPFVCSGTGTTTACTGSCTPGVRSCVGNSTPQLCDSTGTNQPQTPCTSVCTGNGVCAGECVPNQTRCAAGSATMVETCDANGHWGPATACTYVCDAASGNCGGECVPGAPDRCSGNTVQACDATGHFTSKTVCSTAPCSQGLCQACTANQKQCNAGKPQTCNAGGTWVDDQPTACPFLCDPAAGVCTGTCVPGTDTCAAGQVSRHCGANAMYDAGTSCPNICDSTTGRCGGVCAPNALRCNGNTSESCGPTGQWGPGTACPFGCDTATGMCTACVDEPLSTTCSGGKCGPTPNNCRHTVQCPATCAGTGQTCGGGGVVGVCGCQPETTAQSCQNGTICTSAVNNCGQMVTCPDLCVAPRTCGGGATPNQCGCMPRSRTQACGNAVCGSAPDGCGGMVACGTCSSPLSCDAAGQCVNTMCPMCPMGSNCGSTPVTVGCTVVNCGTCTGAQNSCSSTTGPGTCQCTPLTTCAAGTNCGTIPNGCSTGTVPCGNAVCGTGTGQQCGATTPNVCGCTRNPTATTCAGKCGIVMDNCGTSVDCGNTCNAPQTCGGGGTLNVCGCTPINSCPAGVVCGSVANGCGGMVPCGTCTPPLTCDPMGRCINTMCPMCPMGSDCGTTPVTLGCNVVSCGNAVCGTGASQQCGATMPNVCGCRRNPTATTCAGGKCGIVADNCGTPVDCGNPCTAPQTCGGGGMANVCGCTPVSCPAGSNCGSVARGCNLGTVSCGNAVCGAGAGQQCGASRPEVCGCTVSPGSTSCVGLCGTIHDSCGDPINCGTCAAPEVCGQNNVCACPVAGNTSCNGTCVDTTTDSQNCGGCGRSCNSLGFGGGCCSGACVILNTFCTDNDGDGFAPPGQPAAFSCSTTAPPGTIPCNGNPFDCCDSDARQFPGSTYCDSAPSNPSAPGTMPGTCATFDYNCDGSDDAVTCQNHVVTHDPLGCNVSIACAFDASNNCTGTCTQTPGPGGQDCNSSCTAQGLAACGATTAVVGQTCATTPGSCFSTGGAGGTFPQSCN